MKTILLIEDTKESLFAMTELLELADYKVLAAEDGKTGINLAIQHKPDLIVCDIMMPVLDGYGVIHMLQKNPETQNIPFIFLTAKADRSEMRKGMELGADDYITKPFNNIELLNAIESRLRKNELLKNEISSGLAGLNSLMNTLDSKEILESLAEDRVVNTYKKKEIVYKENSHPARLYYLQKGKIKTYKTNEDGKELVVSLYSAGDFFGYVALLEGSVYKETAEAIEESEVALIPKKDFEVLIHNNKEIMQKFIQLLVNYVTEKETHLLNIAYNSLRKKVADALITLHKKYKPANNEPFAIDISRDSLATIAGTAKESLIRTLADFKEEKLIEIKTGNIYILDEKRLEKMYN